MHTHITTYLLTPTSRPDHRDAQGHARPPRGPPSGFPQGTCWLFICIYLFIWLKRRAIDLCLSGFIYLYLSYWAAVCAHVYLFTHCLTPRTRHNDRWWSKARSCSCPSRPASKWRNWATASYGMFYWFIYVYWFYKYILYLFICLFVCGSVLLREGGRGCLVNIFYHLF